jgi:hypothetical protein
MDSVLAQDNEENAGNNTSVNVGNRMGLNNIRWTFEMLTELSSLVFAHGAYKKTARSSKEKFEMVAVDLWKKESFYSQGPKTSYATLQKRFKSHLSKFKRDHGYGDEGQRFNVSILSSEMSAADRLLDSMCECEFEEFEESEKKKAQTKEKALTIGKVTDIITSGKGRSGLISLSQTMRNQEGPFLTATASNFANGFGTLDSGSNSVSSSESDLTNTVSSKKKRREVKALGDDDVHMLKMQRMFEVQEEKENDGIMTAIRLSNKENARAIADSNQATNLAIREGNATTNLAIREGNASLKASFDNLAAILKNAFQKE